MALASYSDLLAAVPNWLHRSDLVAVIPDFVNLAESQLNRLLRVRQMETRVTTSSADEYLTLPTGYVALRRVELQASPVVLLEQRTPAEISAMKDRSGPPQYFALVGGEIQVFPTPGAAYIYEIDYYAGFDLATTGTNWLLTDFPDTYLYGTLAAAAPYIGNDARLATWQSLFVQAVDQVRSYDAKDRWPGPLTVRPDVYVD